MAQAIAEDVDASMSTIAKYLTFNMGNEQYGIEILKVREIIGLMVLPRFCRQSSS